MSDDLVFDETDLEDAEQNNENGSTEEEEATPPTIIMRDLNRRRKSSMMRKQSTPEENSHLNEVVNSTRMDTSDEHDESDQRLFS